MPSAADENVRWLEIAMDDQVGVGVTDCREHVEDQPQPVSDAQAMGIGEGVDRLAVDVFEDEIRLAARAHAGVEQPRDIRV